jgi:molybdate transport system permease protein
MPADLSPIWISLKTATTATGITIILGVSLAYWIVFGTPRLKTLIDTLLILPMALPPTVVGFLLLYLFGRQSVVGQFLYNIGFNIVFSWTATVIAAVVVSLPLMYRSARGAFEQMDPSIKEAGHTLGAGKWPVFWRIILPAAFPGICAGILLSFARALGEFGATLMVAGNLPGQTQTIPLAVYSAMDRGDTATAAFWSLIVLAMSFAAILALNLWTHRQQRGHTQ